MELWIRSQDKTRLTKISDLYLAHDDNNFCDYIGNNIVGHLGKYTQVGRALEVLDEIQNILKPRPLVIIQPGEEMVELLGGRQVGKVMEMNQNIEYKELSTYVYEMPKE